jgi:hypothetical protein
MPAPQTQAALLLVRGDGLDAAASSATGIGRLCCRLQQDMAEVVAGALVTAAAGAGKHGVDGAHSSYIPQNTDYHCLTGSYWGSSSLLTVAAGKTTLRC